LAAERDSLIRLIDWKMLKLFLFWKKCEGGFLLECGKRRFNFNALSLGKRDFYIKRWK
jgi:hypothetical protein